MKFEREDIIQLSRAVCETMLDLPIGQAEIPSQNDLTPHPTTCTKIDGSWHGAVTLDCSMTAASLAAAVMFGKSFEEVSSDDRRDAMLELANVVGGNIKSLLPETCCLSLPMILSGATPAIRFVGSRMLLCVTIPTQGHAMTVSVFETALSEAA